MGISNLLNAGGGKSFKFDHVGATVTGTVDAAEVVQKRNFDTGEPEFWSDGGAVQQIKVTLATSERDPGDAEDDGTRNVYIKGWGDQLRALKAAIKAAGASDIEPGGTFTATYVRDGELPAGKRGFPPKVYEYVYKAPSGTAGLLADPAPAATPAVQPSAPQAAPQPAPAAQSVAFDPTAFTPEQLAAIQQMQATRS